MRYLSIVACVMLVLGLMGCKASNTPPEETPGQVPPDDPDHTGRPGIHKVLVTDVEKGEPASRSLRSVPAAQPEPQPAATETPAAEPDAPAAPDAPADTVDDAAPPAEPDTTDNM